MNNLEKLQQEAYKILCVFDEFCSKYNLVYFLCAGTLLGAVRHKGFIPWDDDIDVSMPREDYDRLLSMNNYLPSDLVLQHHNNTDYYPLNFAKLVNKNTTVVEQGGQNNFNVRGVYIDIFPIDGAGRTYKKAVHRRKRASIYQHLIPIAANIPDNKSRPFYKRVLMALVRKLNAKKLQNRFESFLRAKPYTKCKFVAVFVGAYGLKEIMPNSVYGTPDRIKFIDKEFNAPAQSLNYLTTRFGDYMLLPPIQKRVSEHKLVYINFELPFSEFNPQLLKNIST